MNLLKTLFVVLLFTGFCVPSYAAVDDVETFSSEISSEAEASGDNQTEDEEPECD